MSCSKVNGKFGQELEISKCKDSLQSRIQVFTTDWNRLEWLGMECSPTKWNVGNIVKWNILDQDGMVWNRMVGMVRAGPVAKALC